MPHVALPGGVQLYYTMSRAGAAQSPPGASSTSTLSLEHPTLVLLSPSWLDVTMLEGVLNDELRRDYNIVAFDLLSHGQTRNEPKGSYDHAVGAATIAFAMESLHIPPSHIYGSGAIAFHVALKFVLLFPNQVLSLSLAGITGLFTSPPPDRKAALVELTKAWCFPEDEEDYYEALDAMSMLFLSMDADQDVELSDEIIGALVRRYSPYQLRRTYEVSAANHQSSHISKESLASIGVPVLVMHGTNDVVFPMSAIDDIRDSFTNAEEVVWEPIEGGPHMLALTHSKLVSSLFTSFLSRRGSFSSTVVPLDLHHALQVASDLGDNPRILQRNPRQAESYSLLSPEERDTATRTLQEYARLEGMCQLDLPGTKEKEAWEQDPLVRPRQPWKFSTRNLNVQRSTSARQSLVGSISVQVETSLPPIPVSTPDESLRNLSLEDPGPPVPPKDGDSPSWGGSQWQSTQTVRTSSH